MIDIKHLTLLVEDLTSRLAAAEARIQELEDAELDNRVTALEDDVVDIEDRIDEEVTELKSLSDTIADDLTDLESRVENLENDQETETDDHPMVQWIR